MFANRAVVASRPTESVQRKWLKAGSTVTHRITVASDSGAAQETPVVLATFFQAFYNLRSNRLQGLEALARGYDAADGHTALPASFFSAASASGMMRDIDLWILDDALSHLATWRSREGYRDLILSVNLSWDLISHPRFVRDLSSAVERHDVPGDRLLVDIATDTFRRLKSGDESALARLHQLQEQEITFCLDGFTAKDVDLLPAAAKAPVDIIKIHPHQLAHGYPSSSASSALTKIAQTVHDVELPIVAAGIETPQQLERVRALEFEWAQGFLLAEPVAASQALSCPASLPAP